MGGITTCFHEKQKKTLLGARETEDTPQLQRWGPILQEERGRLGVAHTLPPGNTGERGSRCGEGVSIGGGVAGKTTRRGRRGRNP